MIADLLQDIRLALRLLLRAPGFAIVAILTLGLGIGANSAVFTAVNSVLLSPLPYNEPEQLVRLYTGWTEEPRWRGELSGLDFVDYRENISAFERIAAMYTYREQGLDLMGPNGPVRIRALPVSSGYFETYRVTPLSGRTFRPEEESAVSRVVILSHAFWRNQMESAPDIIGSTLTLDDVPYTVIGVMRAEFFDVNAGNVDVWIPQDLVPGGSNSRDNLYLSAIARLRAGTTVEQAQAELDALHAELQERFPRSSSWKVPWITPMFDDVVRESGTMLFVLMGAAVLVLLIACVNVANLALTRGLGRRKELAIRLALGSRRGRLVRQLLTEGVLIAVLGGLFGFVVAVLGMKVLLVASPDSLARAEEIGFDTSLVAFTLVVIAGAGLLLGLPPALGLAGRVLRNALREDTRTTPPRRSRVLRAALVTGQVSLAVMLLVGAGLLMRSFFKLQRIEAGYEPRHVTTFEVHLPDARYDDAQRRVTFHRSFQERLSNLPGIRAVGSTSWLPVNGVYHQWGLRWDGGSGDEGFAIQVRVIEGEYFQALRIPLLDGRTFEANDRLDTQPVALLNATAARMAFEGAPALNRRVRVGGQEWMVVGVVGDVAHTAQGDVGPKIYISHSQFGDNRNWAMIQVISTTTDRNDVLAVAREELAAIDPQLVIHRPQPMTDVAAGQIAQQRFALIVMSVFAVISLALAAVGLYGVLSYSVTQRFHEMGIRMALGARGSQVLQIVARQGAVLITFGLVTGLAGAALLGRFIQSLTFEVSVTDPVTFGVVAGVIATVSVIAMALPARRAVTADPVDALRSE